MREQAVLLAFILFLSGLAALVFIVPQMGVLTLGTAREQLLSVQAFPLIAGGVAVATTFAVLALRWPWLYAAGFWLKLFITTLAGGLVVAHAWESFQVLELGHLGMSNLYEVSLLLLFLLGVLGSMFEKATPRPIPLGAGVAVLMMVNTFFALWLHKSGYAGAQELLPALQSAILPWHVLANFIAYACFFVAAVAGVVVLISRDKEVAVAMHVLSGRAIAVGFPMFSLAVLLGCLWAYQAWGGYWSWDPKETWALIVWLTYAGYLHARLTRGWGARALAWWSIIGFAATLFCYIGVNMFLTGLHSYGSL